MRLVWGLCAIGLLAAGARPAAFTIATAPYRFSFPRDHASHPAYKTEWWYFTGHLTASDGRRFGYELTFFRVGMRPGDPAPAAGESRWRGHELYPAHFAITDVDGRTFVYFERFAREALGMGSASSRRLAVRVDNWWLHGRPLADPQLERMSLHAASDGAAIDLVAIPEKPPAIHGHGGVSRKAACRSCAAHYYSYTRLRTSGTLRLDGRRFRVDGISWMDHEFGSDELQANQAGWDWFSVQLDDGRELMLYRLRERDGKVTPQSSGSLIARDGSVQYIPHAGFEVTALGSWMSPHSHARYPSGWHIRVPADQIDLVLEPLVPDQELVTGTAGVAYWEGAVSVRSSTAPTRRLGVGYVELTGYASPISF